MIILCFVLAFVALWHFIVEGIIAPSERAAVRWRLFALRDELRQLQAEGHATAFEFEEAQRVLNNLIRLAPTLDVFMLVQWEMKLKSDKALAARLEQRRREFDAQASRAVKALLARAYGAGADVLRVNSLGWIGYLVPLILGAAIWSRVRREVTKLTSATEQEWSGLATCPA